MQHLTEKMQVVTQNGVVLCMVIDYLQNFGSVAQV
jgi:hypothetical protein